MPPLRRISASYSRRTTTSCTDSAWLESTGRQASRFACVFTWAFHAESVVLTLLCVTWAGPWTYGALLDSPIPDPMGLDVDRNNNKLYVASHLDQSIYHATVSSALSRKLRRVHRIQCAHPSAHRCASSSLGYAKHCLCNSCLGLLLSSEQLPDPISASYQQLSTPGTRSGSATDIPPGLRP